MITVMGSNPNKTGAIQSLFSFQRQPQPEPQAKADIKFGASDRFERFHGRTIPDRNTEMLRFFIKNSRATDHSRTSKPKLIEGMTQWIVKGADVNGQDTEGNSPLHTLTRMKPPEQPGMNRKRLKGTVFQRRVQMPLIKQLLKADADPNQKNRDQFPPLYLAAAGGKTLVLDQLLKSGADVNQRDGHKRTALYIAVQKGKEKTVKRLLQDPNINVDCADEEGTTPLLLASASRNAVIAKMLLNRGANVNHENECGDRPLFVAAKPGQEDVGKLLWQEDVVDLLVRKGADLEKYRFTQIDNKHGSSLFSRAVQLGAEYPKKAEASVKAMLKAGADVNSKTPDGESFLHLAVENSLPNMLEILLQASGVDVDAKNRSGETPLFLAVKQGKPEVAAMLLNAHADSTVGNKQGITPLSIAKGIAEKHGDSTLLQLLEAKHKQNPASLFTMA